MASTPPDKKRASDTGASEPAAPSGEPAGSTGAESSQPAGQSSQAGASGSSKPPGAPAVARGAAAPKRAGGPRRNAATKWFNREVFGWAMFDFANQAFTLVILTTMFHLYFVHHIVPDDDVRGRQLWATSGIVALIVVVLISPIVGALADFSGAKKRLLFTTYVACVALTASLALVPPGAVALGMTLFIAGYIFYAVGENFMAAFLPELAAHRNMGKVSAFGWTLGYVGGLTCLAGAAVISSVHPDEVAGYRWICVWAAFFFLLAALPTFILLRERKQREDMPPGQTMVTIGFHRIAATFRDISQYKQLFRFLGIMTFYLAGMQIVIWFAGSIATKLFRIPDHQLPIFLLVLTGMAIVGAFTTGRFQDRLGARLTITLALVLWMIVMSGAAFVPEPAPGDETPPNRAVFWLLGSGVGFGMGMLGTSSRAMVGL
ncbi:MAG: MFS transporter, partial [Planctomycetota bacterium]